MIFEWPSSFDASRKFSTGSWKNRRKEILFRKRRKLALHLTTAAEANGAELELLANVTRRDRAGLKPVTV